MNICPPCIRQTQSGFTLVELMVALSILAVLTTLALPDLRQFVVSNRLSSDVNSFVGLINYARSEAIARNQDVVICPISNGGIACASDASWGIYQLQVFVDANGNGDRNAGELLLKTVPATDTTGTQRIITRDSGVGHIRFSAAGYSQTAHQFDISAVGDAAYQLKYGRSVCISRPGRVRVTSSASGSCS
jgi:type IV fimbrial biogenesis protein FimT